jgi:hypothetical protein
VKNILIACEESQAVTKKLRDLGHNAYSCDLLPCSGEHPEWHIQGDVFDVIKENKNISFKPAKGPKVNLKEGWDMMIAHPPCTFLASSGAQWFYHPEDSHLPTWDRRPHPKYPNRKADQESAIDFVKNLLQAPIKEIAVENPVGVISAAFRPPDQIVQPYMFGDAATKTTCLWLRGLPLLTPLFAGEDVDKGERVTFKSGKSQPKWYADALAKAKTPEERRTLRSKTFEGMAEAFAYQWAGLCDLTPCPTWLTKEKIVEPTQSLRRDGEEQRTLPGVFPHSI